MANGNPLMVERGDQVLIGDTVLVDATQDGFKVYESGPNPAYPDDSTEENVWTQVGDEYETRDAAVMAAVNHSAGA